MASTLSTIIAKVQALLNDDGTIFTTSTVTAAVRQALQAYNQRAPMWKTTTISAADGQYEYELSAVTDIEFIAALLDPEGNYMPHEKYFVDGDTFYIRLKEPTSADFRLVYASPHTIDGLDGESTTTMQANHENCLCDLAAGISVVIRANGRVETVNLNADVPAQWMKNWELWKQAFGLGLVSIQRAERMPLGVSLSGWNDDHHGWE